MAARRETTRRKSALLGDLRELYHNGDLPPGEMLPSVRELAEKYQLSVGAVGQQLRALVQEGVLYTVPGSGTFIGRKARSEACFVLVLGETKAGARFQHQQMRAGFEDEIALRGGTSLVLTSDQNVAQLVRESVPSLAGIFIHNLTKDRALLGQLDSLAGIAPVDSSPTIPVASCVDFCPPDLEMDLVDFDNVGGGCIATRHLLDGGHRCIAYLGIHGVGGVSDDKWSAQRQRGWQQTLENAGLPTAGLAFLPRESEEVSAQDRIALIGEAAQRLIRESRATAVVVANDDAAIRLLEACRVSGLPRSQWPSIVSFDDTLPPDGYALTSLRLPWEGLGRAAARLLWERAHGKLSGPPVCHQVPLRIISRLSCRNNWSTATGLQTCAEPALALS